MEYLSRARTFVQRNLLAVLIGLLVVLLAIGYALGYRPGPGFTVVRTGQLIVTDLPAGATVYTGESRRGTSEKGGDMVVPLVPGTHSVIVDVPGMYPWNDLVQVTKEPVRISPILVPTATQTASIPNEERAAIEALVKAAVLPTAVNPLVLENGCALVRVDNNRIAANGTTTDTCVEPWYLCVGGSCADTIVFSPIAPLRSVLPFPGRPNALLIAYGDTIAVLELNPLAPQYFAPIYKGLAPAAVLLDDHTLAVTDDTRTFKISF